MSTKRGPYKAKDEVKSKTVTVRITEEQLEYIEHLIASGKGKTNAAVIQYLINQEMILGDRK